MTTLRLPVFTFSLLLLALVGCDKGSAATPEQVRAKAQECADAMLKGDYAKVVDLTHPKLVAGVGGRQKMIDILAEGVAQAKAHQSALVSYKAQAPSEILGSGLDLVAVVPTALEMKTPKGTVKQSEYVLAVSSDAGRNWTFVDGGGLTPETLKSVVPNPPKELKLPGRQAPVME